MSTPNRFSSGLYYQASLLAIGVAGLFLVGCPPKVDDGLGIDPTTPAGPGIAYAGVIRDGSDGERALFGGIAAEGRAGDVKIYNDKVQFIIQGAYRSHGYVDTGGFVIDADIVRKDGSLGRDCIDDLFTGFGMGRLFHADTVEIVADGTEGGPAIVRSTGRDVGWVFLSGAVEASGPLVPEHFLEVTNDFILEPDVHRLTIRTTYTNAGSGDVTFQPTDGMIAADEDLVPWIPDIGLGDGSFDGSEALGVTGKHNELSLLFWSEEGTLDSLGLESIASSAGLVAVRHPTASLGLGESVTIERHWAVGADPNTVEAERITSQGTDLGTVTGRITDQNSDAGVGGARVHFAADDNSGTVAAFAITQPDGSYQAKLPPGSWQMWVTGHGDQEHVELPPQAGRYAPFAAKTVNQRQLDALGGATNPTPIARAWGRSPSGPHPVSVTTGSTTQADAVIDSPARLELTITDDLGSPIGAVVQLQFAAPPDASALPANLYGPVGEPIPGSAPGWAWTANGQIGIDVLPGTYQVIVGHSWRHERQTLSDVVLNSGTTTSFDITLDKVVEHDGWLAADHHLHAAPSADGSLPMEDRLIACAATGVDLPITTDHDRQADYRPLVDALGLSATMQTIPGIEVSPVVRGHFNLYPVAPKPLSMANGGAEPWWNVPASTSDLFQRMRDGALDETILQVNHPFGPGMFSIAQYTPATGQVGNENKWSWDFDAFELINGKRYDEIVEARSAWFSFLNQGEIHTPVGASDSHSRSSVCGYGRTDVFVDTSSPEQVTPQDFAAAIRAGHVVVAGGLTLRADINNGAFLPGDTTTMSTFDIDVTVRAPSWIVPEVIRLYRNGVLWDEAVITGPPVGGLWMDTVFTIDESTDAWYTVECEGTQTLGQTWGGSVPYAITNAFFVDPDGNGWVAPGLP